MLDTFSQMFFSYHPFLMDNLFFSRLDLFTKGSIFETLSGYDSISSKFKATVAAY